MNNIISLWSYSVLFLFLILGCNEKSTEPIGDITAKPVVKNSSVNYDQELFYYSLPDTISLHNMREAYSNNYSEEIREELIEYIISEVNTLGEDAEVFDNILSQTGCNLIGEYLLPTYAEKAMFENQEAWIIQLAYGLGNTSFAHYKCLAFGVENLDTLAYKSCR